MARLGISSSLVSSIILYRQLIKGQIGAVTQFGKEVARIFIEDLAQGQQRLAGRVFDASAPQAMQMRGLNLAVADQRYLKIRKSFARVWVGVRLKQVGD